VTLSAHPDCLLNIFSANMYFNGIVVEELTAFVLSIPAILTPLD
jgi:hypothetical protein